MNDKRRYYRHPVHYPVQVFEDHQPSPPETATEDISLGGICIVLQRRLGRGSSIRLDIPVGDRIFKLKGKVTYCVKTRREDLYKTGIAFREPSDQFMAKMAEELISINEYRGRLAREKGQPLDEVKAAELWIRKNAKRFAELFDASGHSAGSESPE